MSLKALFYLTAVLMVPGTAAPAQDQAMALKRPPESQLRLLQLSHDLAQYGRANKDAVALITAAQMQRAVAQKDVIRSGDELMAEKPTGGDAVQNLAQEAIALAQQDPFIVALAQDLLASKAKGHVKGVAVSRGVVPAGKTDVFKGQKFESGKYAEAYVEAQGAGEIRLAIYDAQGNLVCKDSNPADTSYCGWWPKDTQDFTLSLENRSETAVAYKVSTN